MPDLPPHITAMLSAMRFRDAQTTALRRVTDSQWSDLFCRWEILRLLVPLRQVCGGELPEWVRARIDQNVADNAERFERIKLAYSKFACKLHDRRAEHLVVKGFAQWPDFVEHPRLRLQSDIDVYCPHESLRQALDALFELGYEPNRGPDYSKADHLPTMALKTPWIWRGNCYDPEIPPSFELHFCFWNETLTRLHTKGPDQFWLRRVERRLDNLKFPALAPVDNLGYAALNALRDTLFGPITVHLIYEVARFLETNAGNEHFWKTWQELHDDSIRRLEVISFCLASHYFGCRLSEEVETEIDRLPKAVRTWFQQYADSPLSLRFRPNKDALWLHMSLLESLPDKRAVLLKRLLPTRIPSAEAPQIQNMAEKREKNGGSARKRIRYVSYLVQRVVYHARIMPITVWHGVRWWWSAAEFNIDFLTFMTTSFLFTFGMYVFFFLYNLYLLDRGFRENFLGLTTSAVIMGGVAGTLPAGLLVQRLGLRKALLVCLTFASLVSMLRSVFVSAVPLVVLAFLAGFISVIWAVAFSPAVAQFTSEKTRTFGFSVVFFFGIAVGVLGGQVGGRLPGWLMHLTPRLQAPGAKEVTLLLACGIIALGIIPASRLRFKVEPVPDRRTPSRNPFLIRFLVAIAVWSVAIGGFSSFFSAYFSRYWHMPVKQIGTIDSMSRVTQLLAILAAPALFRKLGLVTGTAFTQLATAVALISLAFASKTSTAAAVYMGYVAFQWMNEPAIYALLMDRVEPKDRARASALNFLVVNSSQAIAGLAAGASFIRFGYPVVLAVTAGVALAAALSFWLLLGKEPAIRRDGALRRLSVPPSPS